MFVTPQYHGGALCRTWVQDSEHGTSVVVREVQGAGTGLDSIRRPIPVSGVGPVPAPEELAGMDRGRTCEPPCPKAGCGKTSRPDLRDIMPPLSQSLDPIESRRMGRWDQES